MMIESKNYAQLLHENAQLRKKLEQTESALQAERLHKHLDTSLIEEPICQTNELSYRNLVEHLPEGVALLTLDGKLLYANTHLIELLQINRKSLPGISLFDYIIHTDHSKFYNLLQEKHLKPYRLEIMLQTQAKTIIPVLVSVKSAPEFANAVYIILSDLTTRKRVEKELRLWYQVAMAVSQAANVTAALNTILRQVCDETNWIYSEAWLPNSEQNIMEFGLAWCCGIANMEELHQINQKCSFKLGEGLIGRTWQEKQPIWLREITTSSGFIQRTIIKHLPIKASVAIPVLANQEVVAILAFYMQATSDEDEHFIQLISTISTQLGLLIQRKHTEEKLREVSEQLELALLSAQVASWDWDLEKNLIRFDKHAHRLYGIHPSREIDTIEKFKSIIHPDDQERFEKETAEKLKKDTITAIEFRVKTAEGSVRYLKARGKIYRNTQGIAIRVAGVTYDITELKQAELALQNNEQRLRTIIETASDAYVGMDANGFITHWNRQAEITFGWPRREAIGRQIVNTIIPPKFRQAHTKGLQRFLTTGEQIFSNKRIELSALHRDGHIFPIEIMMWSIPIANTYQFCAFIHDITERKKTEEITRQHQIQLAHVGRINLMGEMASALAHELNQPLAAIANFTKGCMIRLESNNYQTADIIHALQQATEQAEHAGELIHRIKNFARKGKLHYELADINKLIKDILKHSHYYFEQLPATKINFELAEGLPLLRIDKIQIEQVILNLIRNSVEAMHSASVAQPLLIIRTTIASQNFVEICIVDNGPGFPNDLADQLFKSYFTTKPHGMGMGLSISRTIIEAHGGNLSARLNPDGGSCFRFSLPVAN